MDTGLLDVLHDARDDSLVSVRNAVNVDLDGLLEVLVDQHTGAAGAAEGRWSLLPEPAQDLEAESLAEAVAEQLLARWGVVVRDVLARENLAVPWRELSWAFRRLEARGSIRGGRFVTGFTGEQFALPAAVEGLRATRRRPRSGERIVLAATDPLNLTGILSPGPRVPAHSRHQVTYQDGSVVAASLPGSHAARQT